MRETAEVEDVLTLTPHFPSAICIPVVDIINTIIDLKDSSTNPS
jgi:hypothetical protein